jgi:hypothetical protein
MEYIHVFLAQLTGQERESKGAPPTFSPYDTFTEKDSQNHSIDPAKRMKYLA